jgi:hypothetical protein
MNTKPGKKVSIFKFKNLIMLAEWSRGMILASGLKVFVAKRICEWSRVQIPVRPRLFVVVFGVGQLKIAVFKAIFASLKKHIRNVSRSNVNSRVPIKDPRSIF